ncbi:MAG: hypothetical protein WBA48_11515, partial [Xanthobacteraceae bacterium]
ALLSRCGEIPNVSCKEKKLCKLGQRSAGQFSVRDVKTFNRSVIKDEDLHSHDMRGTAVTRLSDI